MIPRRLVATTAAPVITHVPVSLFGTEYWCWIGWSDKDKTINCTVLIHSQYNGNQLCSTVVGRILSVWGRIAGAVNRSLGNWAGVYVCVCV